MAPQPHLNVDELCTASSLLRKLALCWKFSPQVLHCTHMVPVQTFWCRFRLYLEKNCWWHIEHWCGVCLVWWLKWSWYLLLLWKAFLHPSNGQIKSSALSRSSEWYFLKCVSRSLLLLNKLPQTSQIIGWCFFKLCWRSDCLSLKYVWQSLHLTSFAFASCDFR